MMDSWTQERYKTWMDENSHKSQLLLYQLDAMNPDVGFYVTVNEIEISEDFFQDEYDKICEAYNSVLEKMTDYYNNNKK